MAVTTFSSRLTHDFFPFATRCLFIFPPLSSSVLSSFLSSFGSSSSSTSCSSPHSLLPPGYLLVPFIRNHPVRVRRVIAMRHCQK